MKKFIKDMIFSFRGRSREKEENIDRLSPELKVVPLPGPFAYAIALGSYSVHDFHARTDMGSLIHLMKYHYSKAAADRLTTLLIQYLEDDPLPLVPDVIITVPDSLTNRPFRPVAFLADALGGYLDRPARHDIIRRVRLEKPQKDRSFEERLADDRPRYGLQFPEVVRRKHVLLFDDIYATGRSLNEAAGLINEHSPRSIMALTLVKLGQ